MASQNGFDLTCQKKKKKKNYRLLECLGVGWFVYNKMQIWNLGGCIDA